MLLRKQQNNSYHFSYHVTKGPCYTNTIKLTIPPYKNIYTIMTNDIIIQTNKSKDYQNDIDEDLKFEVKFANDKFCLDVWYSAPVSMNLTVIFSELLANTGSGYTYATRSKWVPANEWQLLASLPDFHDEGYRQRVLQFQFIISNQETVKQNVPKSKLHSDLETLLKNSSLSDVTIISYDGVVFPAHKAILAARSAVFKAHFDHGTEESVTNTDKTLKSSFDAEELSNVLHYMYTDEVPLDKVTKKMFRAADFYQLDGLKIKCEKYFFKSLSVDNAVEILKLADLYSATELKSLSIKFIHCQFEEVKKTEGWKTLQSPELIKSIFDSVIKLS